MRSVNLREGKFTACHICFWFNSSPQITNPNSKIHLLGLPKTHSQLFSSTQAWPKYNIDTQSHTHINGTCIQKKKGKSSASMEDRVILIIWLFMCWVLQAYLNLKSQLVGQGLPLFHNQYGINQQFSFHKSRLIHYLAHNIGLRLPSKLLISTMLLPQPIWDTLTIWRQLTNIRC